jgi:hypothetical protein
MGPQLSFRALVAAARANSRTVKFRCSEVRMSSDSSTANEMRA